MDFVADKPSDRTRLRALTVVDVFAREAICIRVGSRLRAEHFVEACSELVAKRGAPVHVFVDNGSEFSGNDPARSWSRLKARRRGREHKWLLCSSLTCRRPSQALQ